jgi:hypothetical protein
MGDIPHGRRRFLVGIAGGVLAALVVLTLAAGGGVATDHANLTREDGEIRVAFSKELLSKNATAPNASVAVGDLNRTVELRDDGGRFVGSVGIKPFDAGDPDLSNVTVRATLTNESGTVVANGTPTVSRSLNLQQLPVRDITFENGTVVVRVDTEREVGVKTGSGVPVEVSGAKTVRAAYNGTTLTIPRDRVGQSGLLLGEVTVRPFPGTPDISNNATGTLDGGAPVVDTHVDGVDLRHPFLFEGRTYLVISRTTGPSGSYRARQNATGGEAFGAVTLPTAILFANETRLTVETAEGDPVLKDHRLAASTSPSVPTLTANGTNVSLGDLRAVLGDDNVEAVWVNTTEGVRRFDHSDTTGGPDSDRSPDGSADAPGARRRGVEIRDGGARGQRHRPVDERHRVGQWRDG